MPRHPHAHRGGIFDHPAQLLATVAVALFLGWIWLVASLHLHEMIVGAVVVILSTAFCALVLRSATLPLQLRLQDLLAIGHVPSEILKDTWVVLTVLYRDLFRGEPAGSFYRVAGFRTSRRDPVLVARSALAITFTTLSPNVVVIGIDPTQGHILFHQLQRDDVPSSTRALGAGQ